MFHRKALTFPFINSLAKLTIVMSLGLTLASCDLAANYTKTDRGSNMEFQDFRDGLSERLPELENDEVADMDSIPELLPYVTATPESMKSVPLVSISVNQTVPLREIFFELAEQAEYDLELDPNIRGSVIFTARNKPFDVVVDRIAKMAGLRYKFEDGFLRVEVDHPYIETYKIDYLSFIRSNQSGVNTSVSVVSGDGADTGSNFASTSESTSDFWAELELNLEQLLGGASTGALKTKTDPRITVAEKNPDVDVSAVAPEQGEDGEVTVAPPEVVLNVQSLPIDDGGSDDDDETNYTYSLNKQAGLINVIASERTQRKVATYLNELRRSVTAQVLVEAKVFEVTLKDEFITGIEWNAFLGDGLGRFTEGSNGILGEIAIPGGGKVAEVSNFGVGLFGSDASAFVKAISGFGTVRALASPRLTVINNQSASLNVATNKVFFELDIDREIDLDTHIETIEIESTINTVPVGVLINVQPSINLEKRTISMFLRPTVTNVVDEIKDPAITFIAADTGLVSLIPEVNVQEIDTVVNVNSGQPIVMGGLLQDSSTNTQEGIPVLSELPIIGAAFRTQRDLISKTELVIFLKATIIDAPEGTIHNTDRDLYRTFSGDRRPWEL